MKELKNMQKYTRKDVHDIFSPETSFKNGCGAWGLRGIVRIKNTKNYVFFVTYGSKQAGHNFQEGIDDTGKLIWQSQPSQDFSSPDIINFINHDEKINDIFLFKRDSKKEKEYVYLGKLKYIKHIPDKVNPVWFEWQIINWSREEADSNPLCYQEKIINTNLDDAIKNYMNENSKDNLIKLFEVSYKSLIENGFSIEDLFNML